MSRDDRNDTDLYLAIGGEVPFKAMRRAMRARWMKARGVSESPVSWNRDPWPWPSGVGRFWCAALGIKPADRDAHGPVHSAVSALALDHVETFTRGGRVVVLTAQVLVTLAIDVVFVTDEWSTVAQRHGLTFEYSLSDSWHYPGRTVLLALWLPGEADRA